jgi:hypothetical protein
MGSRTKHSAGDCTQVAGYWDADASGGQEKQPVNRFNHMYYIFCSGLGRIDF